MLKNVPNTSSWLPSITALQAFEAAARLQSFTKAAVAMNMTHSGVSRHVQTLENWCKAKLFTRHGPRISLTDAGRALHQRLTEPLQQLHQALQVPAHAPSAQPLHILTLPSLATTWLMPRLGDFVKHYPQIAVSLYTSYEIQSMPPQVPCVALRYGVFSRDGLAAHKLFDETMLPAASPMWLRRFGRNPQKWPATQMLRHSQSPWPTRLPSRENAKGVVPPLAEGLEMNDALMLLQAAQAHLGVSWTRARLAESRFADRTLIALTECSVRSERSYWIAYRSELADHPSVSSFRHWALAQVT
jgi:LysR family transcriptional regulator, glycine cleavage system transcriptional activator